MSNGLGQVNPLNKQDGLVLKDHDTIIKWVGLGLSHLVEYPTLTRHEPDTLTRIDTPTFGLLSP